MRALHPHQNKDLSDSRRVFANAPLPDRGNGRTTMRRGQDCNRARILRRRQTNAERRLWHLLRDRRLEGFKFRRQQSIGPYFADFACIDRRLVMETDGGRHLDQAGYDQTRTTCLESRGHRVLRFWNHQVLRAQEEVPEEVLRVLRAD